MDKWLLKSGGALLINSGALSQVSFDFAMCLCMDELGGICIPEKVIVNKHQHQTCLTWLLSHFHSSNHYAIVVKLKWYTHAL